MKMSIKRMLNNKKAISPILATLLLVVIAVAAIVVTYAWITTYMGTTTQQAGVLLKTENIRWTASSTIITVANTGTGDTRIIRVYVGDSAENMTDVTTTYVTYSPSSGAVAAGDTVTVTITWPNALDMVDSYTAGDTYYFRIVPNPGQFLEFQDIAPQ
jgi:archaeal type IV pilus assembly protein PilA